MNSVFVLNEWNLGRFLAQAIGGKRPAVIEIMPTLRFSGPVLSRLVAVLNRFDRLRSPHDIDERLPWCEGWPGRGPYTDVFAHIEDRLHASLDAPAEAVGEAAYPLRKAVSWYADKLIRVLLLAEWLNAHPDAGWCLDGVPEDMAEFFAWYHGRPPAAALRPSRPWRVVINALNALSLLAFVTVWLLIRLRRQVVPRAPFMVADGRAPYDAQILPQLVDRPADLAIYHRNAELERTTAGLYPGHVSCRKEDGRVTPAQLLGQLAALAREAWAVWRAWRHHYPALFAMGFAQVVKRQQFRAFFNVYQPRYLWARDDYSVDHVVRSQELRRHGGQSIGINHGIPAASIHSAWREIDFDTYYTFGTYLYRTYYARSWPPHMRVKPVGNVRLTAAQLERAKLPRPADIAYFATLTGHDEDIVRQVFELARRLPDRKVIFKMKPLRRASEMASYDRLMREEAPANVETSTEDAYELMLRVSYVVGGGTTAMTEALQLGAKTLVIDVFPEIVNFYYRPFPEICVPDGATAAAMILDIEAGRREYPFDRLGGLIVLPPIDVIDAIRSDLGLPPRRPASPEAVADKAGTA